MTRLLPARLRQRLHKTFPRFVEACKKLRRMLVGVAFPAAPRAKTVWIGGPVKRYAPLPAHTFADLEKYLLFIGYPRSGHSIVGALLSAHPEAVVSNELHGFHYLWEGAAREELFTAILEHDRQWSADGCIGGGDYSYAVPGQWQGRYSRLRVIGDKGGGVLSNALSSRDPRLLDKIRSYTGLPLHLLHVTRNPYDIISTMYKRLDDKPEHAPKAFRRDLDDCIRRYFTMSQAVHEATRDMREDQLLILRHEDFIAEPRSWLERILRFLGLGHEHGYLDDCASIVYAKPHKSRLEISWPQSAIEQVASGVRRYPRELGSYDFAS